MMPRMDPVSNQSLILFGAGASFGSDDRAVPPLGANLFPALRAFNPDGWGQLPQDLTSRFEQDFEAGMAALVAARPHDMAPSLPELLVVGLPCTVTSVYCQVRGDGSCPSAPADHKEPAPVRLSNPT